MDLFTQNYPVQLQDWHLFDAFVEHHEHHPAMFDAFKSYAVQLHNAGVRHYSAHGLLHVLRFHTALDCRGHDTYKINNNWGKGYALLLAGTDIRFVDFFDFREPGQRHDGVTTL